jgi:hypothetical protein
MILGVARKLFLGIRIAPELKKDLEVIAVAEERSVSQICELILRRGISTYNKEGSKYFQRSGSTSAKKNPSE